MQKGIIVNPKSLKMQTTRNKKHSLISYFYCLMERTPQDVPEIERERGGEEEREKEPKKVLKHGRSDFFLCSTPLRETDAPPGVDSG